MNVILVVDGKEVPLNEFVSRMLGGMVSGAVMTLKGVNEDWKTLEIKIQR